MESKNGSDKYQIDLKESKKEFLNLVASFIFWLFFFIVSFLLVVPKMIIK